GSRRHHRIPSDCRKLQLVHPASQQESRPSRMWMCVTTLQATEELMTLQGCKQPSTPHLIHPRLFAQMSGSRLARPFESTVVATFGSEAQEWRDQMPTPGAASTGLDQTVELWS